MDVPPSYWWADLASAGAIIGAMAGYIPFVAAAVALIWYLIQIFESRTVQYWLQNRKTAHKARKIAQLKAKEKVIVAQLDALETIRRARVDAKDKVEAARVEAEKLRVHEQHKADER